MALTKTPVCDFGKKAEDFKLKSIENKLISLNDVKGEKATLIMFICNHCPYVKAIIRDLAQDCNELKKDGINTVAIMSNDTKNYPEDSFDNMIKFAKTNNFGKINYLELKDLKPVVGGDSDLKIAMKMISETQAGPKEQIPSMGCNIKWFN